MCGIAGIYLRDPSIELNLEGLLDSMLYKIDRRGGDATGFAALGEGGMEWQKASCGAHEFTRYRRGLPENTRVMIAHTRFATQGPQSFMENNHPIKRGPFLIIHNGHVWNDQELFKAAGRRPFGEVDSEAIAAALSKEGDLSGLGKVICNIEGDAAVAAIDERDPSRLVLARGQGSPLYVYQGKRFVMFGSTPESIIEPHERFIGKINPKRVKFQDEGTLLEWGDAKEFRKKHLILPPKPVYKSSWSGTTTAKYAAGTNLIATKPATLKRPNTTDPGWDIEDEDISRLYLECERCSQDVPEERIDHFWDAMTNGTFMVCADCADILESDDTEVDELRNYWGYRAADEEIETAEFREINQEVLALLDSDETPGQKGRMLRSILGIEV